MTRMFDHRLHNRPLPSTPSHTTYITYTTAHSQAPPHIPHTSHTQPPTPKHPPHIPHTSHTHTAFKLVLKLRLPPGTQKLLKSETRGPSAPRWNPRKLRIRAGRPGVYRLSVTYTWSVRRATRSRERATRARYESALRERATRARCESALRERVCAAESMTRHIMA